jgi:hypothetical protein
MDAPGLRWIKMLPTSRPTQDHNRPYRAGRSPDWIQGEEPTPSVPRKGKGSILSNDDKDAFDLWWEWADKPIDNVLMIEAAIHDTVMALPPVERLDRAKVNEEVRKSGVPKATE